jgi:hypothetical protein
MNPTENKIIELKEDKSIKEIIEIVRIAKEAEESVQHLEDKNRPIIDMKNYGDEVQILQYGT